MTYSVISCLIISDNVAFFKMQVMIPLNPPFCLVKWQNMGEIWPKKRYFSKKWRGTHSRLQNSIKYGIGIWNSNRFYKNRWNKYHRSIYWYEIIAIFVIFHKNAIFHRKPMSALSFIWYWILKSAKKPLLQLFMTYCAQSYQNSGCIVHNLHSSLHIKLIILFSGHSFPFC